MLAREHRLRDSKLFRQAVRRGSRAGNSQLVVHVWTGEATPPGCLVGFVVPKKVYRRAVDRNQLKRQLREIFRGRLAQLPAGVIVVRALPGIRALPYAELERSVNEALARAIRKNQISTAAAGR